jgi:N-methylhydantoinase B
MPIDPSRWRSSRAGLEQIADEMDATLYPQRLPLSRRDRRHAGAGHEGPADLRRRHGLRGAAVIDKAGRRRAGRGDTFLFNDPYDGGTHLNDFRLVRPSSAMAAVLLARLVGHWLDIGGNVPGNYNPRATESFQEACDPAGEADPRGRDAAGHPRHPARPIRACRSRTGATSTAS